MSPLAPREYAPITQQRDDYTTAKGIAVIARGFSHLGWLCVKAAMLVAVAAAAGAGLYYYNHINDEIRDRVREKIAAHYVGLTVDVRSALLVDGEGIEIRGVTISDPNLPGPASELAYFDEIILTCRTELQEFLSGQPEVERVRVRRPRIRATRLADGSWSAARLLPCPKFGKHRVETAIENGVVELIDSTRANSPTFTLREVNLKLHPLIEQSQSDDETVRFEGALAGDYFQRVSVSGRIDPGGAGCRLEGAIDRLDISPELHAALPAELAEPIAALASLRATCGAKFVLDHQPEQQQDWAFSVDGQIAHGRFDHPRLPQPLTELAAEFHVDNGGVVVKKMTAAFGESSIHCVGQLDGFAAGAPLFVELIAEKLLVGRNWETILSPQLLDRWRQFLPAGEVDAHLKLSFDGQQWQPEVAINCRNVSFTYDKFRYRVDHTRGTVTLKDDHLVLNLVAQAAGRDISIKGEVNSPGPDFTGFVEISGRDLAIEPRILEALKPKPREILEALNPAGLFSFFTRIGRNDPSQARPHQYLMLDLKHCSIRYDKFSYPISNITGTVEMEDGRWQSNDLVGANDTGRISCRASLQPTSEGPELALHFTGAGITLEDELRDALPPAAQKVWRDLRPRGSVDLRADVSYVAGRKKPDVQVYIDQIDEQATIEPVPFPYRLVRLQGDGRRPIFSFDSRAGRVDFPLLRAVHGRTSVSAEGFCKYDDQGGWWLHFERLTADGLRTDGDLLAALPPGLKRVVTQLNPTGVVNLDGRLDLAPSGVAEQPLQSAWDIAVNVEQSSIQAGVLLENVSGALNLKGRHDGLRLNSTGELAKVSFTFKDFQFTEVHGPLWLDDTRIILGSRAEQPQPGRSPRPMTGRLYGGIVQADVEVALTGLPRYLLRATLTDGDLERFAREQLAGKQRLSGKVGAGLVLGGEGASLHSMTGGGEIRLSDADIYELPFMVRLLSILSIRLPDKTGFTDSVVEFAVTGDHLDLQKIEFAGDAISLVGKGQMNLNSDVQATLAAIVGRSDWQLPVFKSMLGQASEQFMQIRVDGNLADPQIHREAFPAINQALEQLQAGMQPRVQPLPVPQTSPQAARPAMGRW